MYRMSNSAAERTINNAQVMLLMTQKGHFSVARSLLARHEGGGLQLSATINLLNDGVEQVKKVNTQLSTARRVVSHSRQRSTHIANETSTRRCRTAGGHRRRRDLHEVICGK